MGNRSKGKHGKTRRAPAAKAHKKKVGELRVFAAGVSDNRVKNELRISKRKYKKISDAKKKEYKERIVSRFTGELADKLTYMGTQHLAGVPFAAKVFSVRGQPSPVTSSGRNRIVTLWHGTRIASAANIALTKPRPGNWGMFGPGIYFGQISKARMYAGLGYVDGTHALAGAMLKCRVNLGRTFKSRTALHNGPPLDYDSTHGMRGKTASWQGTLNNDEWVVYESKQVQVLEIWVFVREAIT